ncbi:MAG: hypothetical protein AB1756_09220, partial [Acidobacteriota bacterium]
MNGSSKDIQKIFSPLLLAIFFSLLLYLASLILGFDKTDPGRPCGDCHGSIDPNAPPVHLSD